jgi:hypothetical protein
MNGLLCVPADLVPLNDPSVHTWEESESQVHTITDYFFNIIFNRIGKWKFQKCEN